MRAHLSRVQHNGFAGFKSGLAAARNFNPT
jgi:hypothetical protein